MLWIVIILVGVVVFIRLTKENESNNSNRSKYNSVEQQTPDWYREGVVWTEPNGTNFWDSYDFFIRLGELASKYQDNATVFLTLQTKPTQNNGIGEFEISFFDYESAQAVWGQRIPYLKEIQIPFRGCDATTTAVRMRENDFRKVISDEAPHATKIQYDMYPNGQLQISVRFDEHGG